MSKTINLGTPGRYLDVLCSVLPTNSAGQTEIQISATHIVAERALDGAFIEGKQYTMTKGAAGWVLVENLEVDGS